MSAALMSAALDDEFVRAILAAEAAAARAILVAFRARPGQEEFRDRVIVAAHAAIAEVLIEEIGPARLAAVQSAAAASPKEVQ